MKCSKCGGELQKGVCLLCPMLAEQSPPGGTVPGWPIVSTSLGVHPDQIQESNEFLARNGCSARHLSNGKLEIPDAADKKKILKAKGMVDLDSFN